MRWFLDYSPIFFDFDGLLVNTEHLHYRAYRQMLERHGVSFLWDFPTFASVAHKSSQGLRDLITSHAPALVEEKSWETLYAEKTQEYVQLLEGRNLELMPGAKTLLETVHMAKIPHAVVTNSTREQTEKIREQLPVLNLVPYWITREDYKNPKPSPDAYLKAIEILGRSDKMLGFEDALRGIHALEGASITPVLVCSPEHPQMADISQDTYYYFPSLEQIHQI